MAVELRLIRVAVRRRRRRSRQFTLGLQVRVSFNYVLERLYTEVLWAIKVMTSTVGFHRTNAAFGRFCAAADSFAEVLSGEFLVLFSYGQFDY